MSEDIEYEVIESKEITKVRKFKFKCAECGKDQIGDRRPITGIYISTLCDSCMGEYKQNKFKHFADRNLIGFKVINVGGEFEFNTKTGSMFYNIEGICLINKEGRTLWLKIDRFRDCLGIKENYIYLHEEESNK